jgi:hypothetical protein
LYQAGQTVGIDDVEPFAGACCQELGGVLFGGACFQELGGVLFGGVVPAPPYPGF